MPHMPWNGNCSVPTNPNGDILYGLYEYLSGMLWSKDHK